MKKGKALASGKSVIHGGKPDSQSIDPSDIKTLNILFQSKSSDQSDALVCTPSDILMSTSDMKALSIRAGNYVIITPLLDAGRIATPLLCQALPSKSANAGVAFMHKLWNSAFANADQVANKDYKNRFANISRCSSRYLFI